jgi:two-component system KDP operon response regulator KdpE
MNLEPLSKSNVLIVDDEFALRRTIHVALGASGFAVDEARNGEEALEAIRRRRFNIVLLDMNMPGMGGIETCRQIRSFDPRAGIVMLTVRDGEEDRVQALEAGADDYVTKPFRFGELKARLTAVLRRIPSESNRDVDRRPTLLRAGDLKLDLDRRSVWQSDREIRLSGKEFDLLSFLMKSQDVPLTHEELLRGAWGTDRGDELQYLRTYVRLLRRKIEDDSAKPQYLLTEPWVGYRFHDPSIDPSWQSRDRAPRYRRQRLPPFDQTRLDGLRIDGLREAIRSNRVSFPSQIPTFERHDRPDLQRKLVQLYFVLGWNCETIASRYGLIHQRVRQILTTWKRRALAMGYIQYIPPAPWSPIT